MFFGGLREPGVRGRVEFKVAGVVDFLDDGEAWELDEVDLAQRQFEKDSSHRSAGLDADELAGCVDHDSGSLGLGEDRSESPESVKMGDSMGMGDLVTGGAGISEKRLARGV
jgi:hypothetical protein